MDHRKQLALQIVQVVLGVVIGALVTLSVFRYRETRHLLQTRYADWRKLNLVLDMVEKNYVDTLDREGMTDAAIVAALGKLDPHSVYLPPVQLEA